MDIAGRVERVPVGDGAVEVCGVTARGIANLLDQFPEWQKKWVGLDLTPAEESAAGPKIDAAIIAAGCRQSTDQIPAEFHPKILDVVLRLTFTPGFGPVRSGRGSGVRRGWKGAGYEVAELLKHSDTHPHLWDYTPRQLAAYRFLQGRDRVRDLHDDLAIGTLAARGDSDDVRTQARRLEAEL